MVQLPPLHSSTPNSCSLPLLVGDRLGGHFELEAVARAGTSDVLYEATDVRTGARVRALVLLARAPSPVPELEADPPRAALLVGARRARSLQSRHAVRVLDAGLTLQGHPWLVTEHVELPTLAARLEGGVPLATADAVDVALAISDVLAEAHAAGFVHGALGPSSVHLEPSASGVATVKLAGVAVALPIAALVLGVTGEVECVIRSPEQLRHAVADARTDVWATGALLHTMLSGRSPFSADTPSGASLSVILDETPTIAGIPDALAAAIRGALARSPDARPQSILELATLLAPFASDPAAASARISARRDSEARAAVTRRRRRASLLEAISAEPSSPVRRSRLLERTAMVAAAVCVAVGVLVGTAGGQLRAFPRSPSAPAREGAATPTALLEVPPDLSLPEGTGLRDPRVERLRRDKEDRE